MDPDRPSIPTATEAMLDWGRKTWGGSQFWSDLRVAHGWRIQRNTVTGHCRMLDAENRRVVSGSWQKCLARFELERAQGRIPPVKGAVVIVLHGLFRTRRSMVPMCEFLEKQGGYTTINISYPSTRASVADHAECLAGIVNDIPEAEELSFVAHSLGNLVIRRYLAKAARPDGPGIDPRFQRMVMLGPPNQGAELAEKIGKNKLFEWVAGDSGNSLARDWNGLEQHLAVPPFEFGIIAGGKGSPKGMNPIISGDDDFIVSVSSTRLAGARDFLVLPVLHTFLMSDPQVQQHTLRFLKHGYFTSTEARQPITDQEAN